MAMLAVPDRIVFQAIGNVIASRGRSRLAVVSNKQSFANVLAEPGHKPLFSHWKHQYYLFQEQYLQLVDEGNTWVAETDVAAFYETIEHHALLEVLTNQSYIDEEIASHLREYLPIWSGVRHGKSAYRGVPQGCLTSDLLANVFLYEFDREFATKEYHYLRYVDDIRLLGPTKEVVQRGLISVDMFVKSLGLLLQTKKTLVRKIENPGSESDRLTAQLSEIDSRLKKPEAYIADRLSDPILAIPVHKLATIADEGEITALDEDSLNEPTEQFGIAEESKQSFLGLIDKMHQEMLLKAQKELRELFWESFKDLDSPEHPFAERHLRFAVYRLEPEPDITEKILPLFVDRPWLGAVIEHYLRKAKPDLQIVEFLKQVVATHNVYDSVVSSAVRLLKQKNVPLREHQALFRRWVFDEEKQWYLKEACILALGEFEDNLSVLLKSFTSSSAVVRRMALIQSLRLARNKDEAIYIAGQAVDDSSPDVANTLIHLIYDEWEISLKDLQTSDTPIPEHCHRYARGYDESLPSVQTDYIRHIMRKSYKIDVDSNVDFRALLKSGYDRAASFLWHAETSYLSNPSRYVSQLDLFHEELLYPLLVDKLAVKNRHEDLAQVEFTDRINMVGKKEPKLSTFAGAIAECRRLRANPETHSRFHRQLTYTNPISWRQRDGLRRRLAGGYQELVQWIEAETQ